jgi:hypothetical protein
MKNPGPKIGDSSKSSGCPAGSIFPPDSRRSSGMMFAQYGGTRIVRMLKRWGIKGQHVEIKVFFEIFRVVVVAPF